LKGTRGRGRGGVYTDWWGHCAFQKDDFCCLINVPFQGYKVVQGIMEGTTTKGTESLCSWIPTWLSSMDLWIGLRLDTMVVVNLLNIEHTQTAPPTYINTFPWFYAL
jgi:hypothetical protein